jgi:hypothetical protein
VSTGNDDDIWAEASADLYLTDPDFEEAFGRARTDEERAAHEIFAAAALLAEPGSSLTWSDGPEGQR